MLPFPVWRNAFYDVIDEKKKCHVSLVISAMHLCLFEFVIQDQLIIKGSKKRYAYKTKYTLVGLTRHRQTINE